MLKNFGSIFSNVKENFDEIEKALNDNGFEIAHDTETSGVIVKEVASLNGEDEDAESWDMCNSI
jgi:hypothetical protein